MNQMTVTIVGVDCATQENRIGLALGCFDGIEAYVEQVTVGSMVSSVSETIAGWVTGGSSTLIALDAPLGWPAALGQALGLHEAGEPIQIERNEMFRRMTDRVIKDKIGKQPLDVGADRIARTAHAALALLHGLRGLTSKALPLAWKPVRTPFTCAIEVYPAATLTVCGIKASGYKGKAGRAGRQAVLEQLQEHISLPHDTTLMERNDDALDAAVCVLAGVDFLGREVIEPDDIQLAKKEGWIWVRKPSQ